MTCIGAELDLRVGGRYRIGNLLPDGRVIWITGEFETITPGRLLAFSWATDGSSARERVTVRFEPRGDAANVTEVTVLHERIANPLIRADHESGWRGCLERLTRSLG